MALKIVVSGTSASAPDPIELSMSLVGDEADLANTRQSYFLSRNGNPDNMPPGNLKYNFRQDEVIVGGVYNIVTNANPDGVLIGYVASGGDWQPVHLVGRYTYIADVFLPIEWTGVAETVAEQNYQVVPTHILGPPNLSLSAFKGRNPAAFGAAALTAPWIWQERRSDFQPMTYEFSAVGDYYREGTFPGNKKRVTITEGGVVDTDWAGIVSTNCKAWWSDSRGYYDDDDNFIPTSVTLYVAWLAIHETIPTFSHTAPDPLVWTTVTSSSASGLVEVTLTRPAEKSLGLFIAKYTHPDHGTRARAALITPQVYPTGPAITGEVDKKRYAQAPDIAIPRLLCRQHP